jgi:hypothetical protein
MDALMDMLEKTITVEVSLETSIASFLSLARKLKLRFVRQQDTHDMLQELEERLGQRVRENTDGIGGLNEEVHGLHDKLEASAEHIVSRVDEIGKDSADEAARLEKLMRDLSNGMDGGLTALTDKIDAKLAQMDGKRDHERDALSGAIHSAEETLSQRVDELHQACFTKIDELSAQADAKNDSVHATLKSTTDSLRSRIDRSAEVSNVKIESSIESLNAKFERANHIFEEKMSTVHDALSTTIRRVEQTGEARYTDMRAHTNGEIQQLREVSSADFAHVNARVDKELKDLHSRLTKSMGDRDSAITRIDKKLDASSQKMQSRFNQQLLALDDTVTNIGKEADIKIQTCVHDLQTQAAATQHFVSQVEIDKEVSQAAISRVDAKLSEAVSKLDNELRHVPQHIAEAIEAVDVRDKLEEQKTTTREHHALFSEQCRSIELHLAQTTTETGAKLQDMLNDLGANHSHTLSLTDALGQKLDKVDEAHSEQAGNLARKFEERCANIEQNLTAKSEAQQIQIEFQHRQLSENFANVETSMLTKIEDVAKVQNQQHDLVTATATAHRAALAERIAEVDGKFERSTSQLDSQQKLIVEEVAGHAHTLEAVTSDLIRVEGTVGANHEQMGGIVKELDLRCTDKSASHDNKIVESRTYMERNIHDLQEESNRLDGKYARKVSEQDHRMDVLDKFGQENRVHFTDLCADLKQLVEDRHTFNAGFIATLDKKFDARCNAQDDRFVLEREHVTELCNGICSKIDEKNALQDACIDAQDASLKDGQEQLLQRMTATTTAQDNKFALQADSIEKNRQRLTDVCEELDTRLSRKDAAQDTRMASMAETIEANHKTCTELARAVKKELVAENALQDKRMEAYHNEMADACVKLAATFETGSAAQSERTAALEAVVGADRQALTDLHKALDARTAHQFVQQSDATQQLSNKLQQNFQSLVETATALEDALASRIEQSNAQVVAVQTHLAQAQDHFARQIRDVAAASNSQLDAHDQTMKIHHQQFLEASRDLDAKFSPKIVALDVRLDDVKRHCLEVCELMGDVLSKKDSEQEQRMENLQNELGDQREQFAAVAETIERRIDSESAIQSKSIESLRQYFDEAFQKNDIKWTNAKSVQDERLHELYESIAANRAQWESSFAQMEDNNAAANAVQDARMQERHEQISDRCTGIENRFDAKNLMQDSNIVDIGSTINKQHQFFSDAISNLDSKFLAKNEAQDDRIEANHAHFTEAVADLHSRFRDGVSERLDRQERAIQEHYDHFVDLNSSVEEHIKESEIQISERIRNNYNHMADVSRDQEQKFLDRSREQDERVDGLVDTIEDHHKRAIQRAVDLDKKFAEENVAQDDRIAALHEHFTEVCDDLAKRFRFGEIEARIDTITNTISDNHQHFTTGAPTCLVLVFIFSNHVACHSVCKPRPQVYGQARSPRRTHGSAAKELHGSQRDTS